MRFKKFLNETATWSDYMEVFKFNKKGAEKIKKQVIKDLKLKRIKDPQTKFQKAGRTLDKFETPDKNFSLIQTGGSGPTGSYRSGKPRIVWRIWDEKKGKFHELQFKNLNKAKEGLAQFLMRTGQVDIPLHLAEDITWDDYQTEDHIIRKTTKGDDLIWKIYHKIEGELDGEYSTFEAAKKALDAI